MRAQARRQLGRLLVLSGVAMLGGCERSDTEQGRAIGMPASFSPAEQVVRMEDRIARCNTVHSFTLPSRVADRLDLSVGPNTAVVSCALQANRDGAVTNLPAQVHGTATALSGNISELDFREVLEEETLSYVAAFNIDARAGVRFDVTILDPQTGRRHDLHFEQTQI